MMNNISNRKILFVHFNGFNGASGGVRRTVQNLAVCMRYGKCSTYQTGDGNHLENSMFIGSNECTEIVAILKEGGYDSVFFDTSLYGEAVCHIKNKCPEVKVIVHYHNFEKRYFEDEDKLLNRVPLASFAANCERLASMNSDVRIYISNEDRMNIRKEYGICSGKDIVIPPALPDSFKPLPVPASEEPYVLFLGSDFYANIEAARFIIKDIAPYITMKAVIAGKGMDKAIEPSRANVEVLGFLPSLSTAMAGAAAFISPVFSGSGSKIKIAEALMHGKYIIASEESLAGYDTQGMAVTVCRSADEFIKAINSLNTSETFYPENREIFLKNHEIFNFLQRWFPSF